MSERRRHPPELSVLGRVVDAANGPPGEIVLLVGGAEGHRVAADALGRFRLELESEAKLLELGVERDGETISSHEVDLGAVGGELVLEAPPRPLKHEELVSIEVAAARPRPLKEGIADALRTHALALGIEQRTVDRVERLLDELDALSDLGLQAVGGDADALENIRGALQWETPFDFRRDLRRFKPGPSDFGVDPCRALPRSPWAVVAAGVLLDGEGEPLWAGRAVSALLRRSEPAVRVARALTGFDAGQIGREPVLVAVELAGAVFGDPRGPTREAFDEGDSRFGARELPGPAGDWPGADRASGLLGRDVLPDLGGILGGRGLGDLLDPCNLEWLECAHTFVTARPRPPSHPPAVGSVQPSDILAGQPTQITLHPQTGGSFGNVQDPAWTIQLGRTLLVPASWDPSAIVLDVPALPPGCLELSWVVDMLAAKQFFDQQTAACARFFGDRRPFPPFVTHRIARVSVVGTPSVTSFTANGLAQKLVAEGCTPVAIAWDVDPLVCSGSAADFDLSLSDDTGATLYSGPDASGSVTVTTGEDRSYTVRATNDLGGASSPPAVATLDVERYQRLTSVGVSPSGLLRPGRQVTITLNLSCAADDPSQVVFTSSHPDRVPGVQVTVPVGQTSASAQVTVGAKCGKVTLSGTVVGVNQAPVAITLVVHDPAVDALVSANLEQCSGGAVTVRVRCATTISAIGLSGPAGFVSSADPPQVTASVPSDPASGTLQAVARFGALAAGTYAVRVQADGVMLDAGQTVVSLGTPSATIRVSPTQVQVCASTSVTVTATATRATELVITREDGTPAAAAVTQVNPCGTLTTSATVPVSDQTTFKAVASRAGATPVTAQAAVGRTTFVATASAVALVNNMDANGVTLYVYVVSVKADGSVSTSRLGAITSPNGSISYTPDRCERFELWALRIDDPAQIATSNWKFRSGAILGHPAFPGVVGQIGGS